MNQEHKILLSNYIDDELSDKDKRKAEYLIKENLECKQYYNDLLEVDTLLDYETDIVASNTFVSDFQAKLEKEKCAIQKSQKIQNAFKISKSFALAASVLLVISLFAYLILTTDSYEVTNPVTNITAESENNQPAVVSQKVDPEMYKYLDILMSGVNFDAILAFDEEDFEVLENSYDLGLLEDAVMTNIAQQNNSSEQED